MNLYAGAHWHAVLTAYAETRRRGFSTELWIASAGYGLVRSDELIKSYGATFASGHADSVWRGARDGDRRRALTEWWKDMCQDRAIADIARDGDRVLFVGGSAYVNALEDDLATLTRSENDHAVALGVISVGSSEAPGLLPATSALRHLVGGTYGSLNARILSLLASEADSHRFDMARIRSLLQRVTPEERSTSGKRQHLGDDAIRSAIRVLRGTAPTISRTRALQQLRAEGMACEQSRFARLWAATAEPN